MFLQHVQDQISKLPTEIRDQLTATGRIKSRLRRLAAIDTETATTQAGRYRICWLQDFIDQDKIARRHIRRLEARIGELLDTHGTTLREESGIGPIAAARPWRYRNWPSRSGCEVPSLTLAGDCNE